MTWNTRGACLYAGGSVLAGGTTGPALRQKR
jgi:hypothetical protein